MFLEQALPSGHEFFADEAVGGQILRPHLQDRAPRIRQIRRRGFQAATVAGTSETMSAKSRFWPLCDPLPVPRRLMSQKTPLARKPCGATIEPLIRLNSFLIVRPLVVPAVARE